MPTTTLRLRRVAWGHRLMHRTVALGLLLVFAFAQNGFAQTPIPLGLSNNYMVTGDYVVGGVGLRGLGDASGFASGTITIPDPAAYAPNLAQQVPAGADIVAAFLYWATVETSGTFAGQNGFFGTSSSTSPITATILGNPNAPTSWSAGGCSGGAQGSKTIVTYRADVSNLIPVDSNGNVQPNTKYVVRLADSGKSGNVPFTLGATLVIVYRLLAPTVPLNAVVIYDGSYAPSNTAQIVSQPMLGFFQAGNDQTAAPIATKITHIVGNGQSNKTQQVYLNNYDASGKIVHSTLLPSLYGTGVPPFPGKYNGSWDNPTWFPNSYASPTVATAVQAGESSETTVVVPSSSNKGCVSWGAIILSTTVQDSDLDGLLDVWKTNKTNGQPNPGYCDAGANRGMSNQGTCLMNTSDPSWVALPGAATPGTGTQDVFIQLDYMCGANPDGTANCDPTKGGISYAPDPQAISNLTSAFSSNSHNINVHILRDDNNVIPAQTCTDNTSVSPPIYCPFPGKAGVVGWKAGFSFLKSQPMNYPDENSCNTRTPPGGAAGSGPACIRRFPSGQNNSYHEAIFGVAAGLPNWNFQDGSLTRITVAGNTLTLTTLNPHGLAVDAVNPNGRVTISDAISNPNLNNTYLVQSIPLVNGIPSTTSFTIQVASATTAPTLLTDPSLSVGSGVVGTGSGVSDLGGADSLISLGLWGVDGQTVPVESGTFMHELGHSLALTHGGLFRTPFKDGYAFSFEPNCKSNHQSVMNYMFQVDLLDGVLDYSDQVLDHLDESAASPPNVLANADHRTTDWYAPNPGFGTPAQSHCDGTPLLPTDQSMFRLQGLATSIAWSKNQDINFDGQIETSLQGYDDWTNLDLRQIGATGNDFWSGGVNRLSGRVEVNTQTINSFVRNPPSLSATLIATNNLLLSWTPPGFGQSQIAAFNIYRSVNGAAFSKPPYATVPVVGTIPPPLPNQSFTDTKVSCGNTYSYFVTTVLTDGRESVPSKTAGPISCH